MGKVGLPGTMTTVVGQTGELGRVVNWIDDAYLNIQLEKPNWKWMLGTLSFPTVASQYAYTAANAGLTDFASWKMNSFRVYSTSVGFGSEQFLEESSYADWRDTYLFGSMRSITGRPTEVAVGPDLTLNFGLIPAAGYTVVGEYYKAPTRLTASADVPALASQFHMLIVYRAMMMYASYESAQEVYQEGSMLYLGMMRAMLRQQVDQPMFGSALA